MWQGYMKRDPFSQIEYLHDLDHNDISLLQHGAARVVIYSAFHHDPDPPRTTHHSFATRVPSTHVKSRIILTLLRRLLSGSARDPSVTTAVWFGLVWFGLVWFGLGDRMTSPRDA